MLGSFVQKISPSARGREIGIWPKRGGQVTLDVAVGEIFKFIRVSTAGNVVIDNGEGQTYTVIDVQPGRYEPVWGYKILSAGTTATGIYWYGGD